ncbi:MAG: hypothetical protein ABIP92_03495 [Arthrobacter sp.]|uniref:hypothetical protein n=1 Tax=unclassified Arthrobacter TaxID=235627 RepID=UPI001CFFF75D|nr:MULTISPECIES: hypothetical protein [unclassified Arthrobacter]MCB5280797.1 hypothetical protein [Arthrobacter sp. ES1]WGZ79494.1 hypothetical protein QI450_16940 [Arthrobacter sp. EM1]
MRSNWGIFRSAAVLVAAALQLTACGSTDVVCPAVGWVSTITVRLEGDLTAVDHVELCTPAGCSVPVVASAQPAAPKSAVPSPPADPSPSAAPFTSARTAINSWLFTVRGQLPEDVKTRVLTQDGTLLAGLESRPEWTRAGGSEECGGPMTTPPITLQLPHRQQ